MQVWGLFGESIENLFDDWFFGWLLVDFGKISTSDPIDNIDMSGRNGVPNGTEKGLSLI
jgi:hypothetical protein